MVYLVWAPVDLDQAEVVVAVVVVVEVAEPLEVAVLQVVAVECLVVALERL